MAKRTMPTRSRSPVEYEVRLTKNETEVHQLNVRLEANTKITAQVQNDVAGFRSDFNNFRASLIEDRNEMKVRLNDFGRPKTGAVIGILSLVIAATGLIGAVIAYAINAPNQIENKNQNDRIAILEHRLDEWQEKIVENRVNEARIEGRQEVIQSLVIDDVTARMKTSGGTPFSSR